jgi:hypothetical protein
MASVYGMFDMISISATVDNGNDGNDGGQRIWLPPGQWILQVRAGAAGPASTNSCSRGSNDMRGRASLNFSSNSFPRSKIPSASFRSWPGRLPIQPRCIHRWLGRLIFNAAASWLSGSRLCTPTGPHTTLVVHHIMIRMTVNYVTSSVFGLTCEAFLHGTVISSTFKTT